VSIVTTNAEPSRACSRNASFRRGASSHQIELVEDWTRRARLHIFQLVAGNGRENESSSRIAGSTSGSHFPARMHKPAVPDRSQHEWQRKIEAEDARMQIASGNRNGMARSKGHVFEHATIFTKRDFTFGAAVEIIENRFRQLPGSNRPKVCNANHSRRRHAALGAGHWDVPGKHMMIRTRRPAPISSLHMAARASTIACE
jgi:hypothetical protein